VFDNQNQIVLVFHFVISEEEVVFLCVKLGVLCKKL